MLILRKDMKRNYFLPILFTLATLAGCQENGYISKPGDVDVSQDNKEALQEPFVIDDRAVIDHVIDSLKKAGVPDSLFITVDQAIEKTEKFENKGVSTARYYIDGYICKLGEDKNTGTAIGDPSYGNAYYYIKTAASSRSNFYCYRVMRRPNGGKYTDLSQLYLGQRVLLNAKLYRYGNTCENYGNGDAYVVVDTYVEPVIETKGDGTLGKPYNTEDILKKGAKLDGQKIYLTAYINGVQTDEGYETVPTEFRTNVFVSDSEKAELSNNSIIVKLAKGSEFRDKLNLKDNPDHLGKKLTVCGIYRDKMENGYHGMESLEYAEIEGVKIEK